MTIDRKIYRHPLVELKDQFPDWNLTQREMIWLWLSLRSENHEHELDPDQYATKKTTEIMADIIRDNPSLSRMFTDQKSRAMLPEADLDWIREDGSKRLALWLMDQLRNERDLQIALFPTAVTGIPAVIAHLDFWPTSLSRKLNVILDLKSRWYTHLEAGRKLLSWFKADEPKKRCEFAWHWFQENQPRVVQQIKPFEKHADLLLFFDKITERASPSAIELWFKKIKLSFGAKKVRDDEKKAGIAQCNVKIPPEVNKMLESLIKNSGLTKQKVLEMMIRQTYKNGLYSQKAPQSGETDLS